MSLIRFVKNNPFRLAEDRILAEQLRLVMGNVGSSVIPAVLLAVLMLAVLSNPINRLSLALWCVLVIASKLGCYLHARHHLSVDTAPQRARYLVGQLMVLNALDGAIWAALCWATQDSVSMNGSILVYSVLTGVAGSSMSLLAPVLPVFVAFVIAEMLVVLGRLFSLGDVAFDALALATILYVLTLLGQASNSAAAARVAIDLRFDLADSHAKLREIEQRELLAQERQRLMQDMHDGLGSSLVSALRVVEHGQLDEDEIAQVLKGCIDDLKLAIDSMESIESDLLLLLATLRFRLEPRLEASGINLVWEVQSVPKLEWLDPKNALHILRILQEAFTNIIKHTRSTEITVATAVDGPWVVVTVSDNGSGFAVDEALVRGGKGLSNQLRRAAAIGAEVDWTSSPTGSCLRLRLPVKRTSV
ncbi:MAG: Signal transduction histidine kinase [Comamonadaceae bacterium]|nr:MAG: Signal transduction histidine kinase [Comamonadaceae bacterium]